MILVITRLLRICWRPRWAPASYPCRSPSCTQALYLAFSPPSSQLSSVHTAVMYWWVAQIYTAHRTVHTHTHVFNVKCVKKPMYTCAWNAKWKRNWKKLQMCYHKCMHVCMYVSIRIRCICPCLHATTLHCYLCAIYRWNAHTNSTTSRVARRWALPKLLKWHFRMGQNGHVLLHQLPNFPYFSDCFWPTLVPVRCIPLLWQRISNRYAWAIIQYKNKFKKYWSNII